MAAVWCVCVYAFLVCLIVNHLRAYTHIRSVDATYFPAAVSRSGLQNLLAGYFLGFIYILTFQLAIQLAYMLCVFLSELTTKLRRRDDPQHRPLCAVHL